MLPGIDGWSVLEHLHTRGDDRPGGRVLREEERRGHGARRRARGASPTSSKPFDIDRLVDAVTEAVGRRGAVLDHRARAAPGSGHRARVARPVAARALRGPRILAVVPPFEDRTAPRAPVRARRPHTRVVHAAGRPLPARVPRAPRRRRHPRHAPHRPDEVVELTMQPLRRMQVDARDPVQRHRRPAGGGRRCRPDRAREGSRHRRPVPDGGRRRRGSAPSNPRRTRATCSSPSACCARSSTGR